MRSGAEETLDGLEHEGLALPPGVEDRVEVSEEDPERTEEEVDTGQHTVSPASPHLSQLQAAGGQTWSQDQASSEGSLQIVSLHTVMLVSSHRHVRGLSLLTSRK